MNFPQAEPVSSESKLSNSVSGAVNRTSDAASSLATSMGDNLNNASEYEKIPCLVLKIQI